jgi:predicted GIY-YIG superfamily endonuclease
MRSCVYVILKVSTETPIYVGKTLDPNKRWSRHKTNTKRKVYKYMEANGGVGEYKLTPIFWFSSEEESLEGEAFLIQKYLELGIPLLNQDRGGVGGVSGWKHSEETTRNMSEIQLKRFFDPTIRDKMLKALSSNEENRIANLKKSLSTPEYKKKRSEIQISRYQKLTLEAKRELLKNATKARLGSKASLETRGKLSESRKKFFRDHPEARERVGLIRLGVQHTEETKVKIGEKRILLNKEQVIECDRLHSQGLSLKKIASTLGCSVKPVFNAIHRVGVYSSFDTNSLERTL